MNQNRQARYPHHMGSQSPHPPAFSRPIPHALGTVSHAGSSQTALRSMCIGRTDKEPIPAPCRSAAHGGERRLVVRIPAWYSGGAGSNPVAHPPELRRRSLAPTDRCITLQVSTRQVRCLSRHQKQRATLRSGPLCLLTDCARGSPQAIRVVLLGRRGSTPASAATRRSRASSAPARSSPPPTPRT